MRLVGKPPGLASRMPDPRTVSGTSGMTHEHSRYESRRKASGPSNPVVLGPRAAAWLFWLTAAILGALIAGSMLWLLTRSLAA